MSNLINNIRSFILTCPFLEGGRVNVDYIGEGMGYSIDPLPCCLLYTSPSPRD